MPSPHTESQLSQTLEDLLHVFIFRTTIRSSLILKEIDKLTHTTTEQEVEYAKMCSIILHHANEVRAVKQAIAALPIPAEEKENHLQTLAILSAENIIYRMGHTLIAMKGLTIASNINTCFVRKTQKFWVLPENVETVQAMVIPYLPVYVFGDDGSGKISSVISSVYLDTHDFYLYQRRIRREQGAKALRIRKYSESSIIAYVELKSHEEGWTGEKSTKRRFLIHTKYTQAFINGTDIWDEIKSINASEAFPLYTEVLQMIRTHSLFPVVKTVYTRTAFQFPTDSSVRISMDTNLSMWIEETGKVFPYAILEVKLEEGADYPWVYNLMNSKLVIPVDKFSKYLHGCAIHYDSVPTIPYWYNQMVHLKPEPFNFQHTPDPHPQFTQINQELAQVITSIINNPTQPNSQSTPNLAATPYLPLSSDTESTPSPPSSPSTNNSLHPNPSHPNPSQPNPNSSHPTQLSLRPTQINKPTSPVQMTCHVNTPQIMAENRTPPNTSLFEPSALRQPSSQAAPTSQSSRPIVVPVRVEPKVFFANERTFLSWLHFSIFIGGIGAALMGLGDMSAALSGLCFVIVSVIFSLYALYLYLWRAKKIREKDIGPYDDYTGPIILVAVFLSAMITSVVFKYPLK
ncbi:hypothetical protein NEHOM01_1834 [Nematocida homosporus]|uniref:uncharacterized protein n=1 Tax=Nematocida homosporus TaxID=1912981 RepID=UPI0022206B67|nr:uncharacterized protein NEHOM01_1834 [Nematocida homosporus]KAI5186976.1 hypothetical protein NEHOM01_1834 [Nematocida homosporus]